MRDSDGNFVKKVLRATICSIVVGAIRSLETDIQYRGMSGKV